MSSSEHHLHEFINHVILGCSIPGVILSILLLTGMAYLQWNPASRPHLNRVSLRLLVYALIANVIFGSIEFSNMKETSPGCSFVAFLYATSSMASACMFCCMALNLQLVLICGVNGNEIEKYYLFGAAFLCGACNIPPWAAGEFGWFATIGKCWLRAPTLAVQLHWMIGTQSVPMLLMSAIEAFCVVNILIFMLLQVSRIQRLRADTSEPASATLASSPPQHPIVQLRTIILRIAMYPLLSCFLSISTCVLSTYTKMHPDLTDFNIHIRMLNAAVYSSRPLLCALLAATDPSFSRAVRSLRPEPLPSAPLEWNHRRTVTTVSFELVSMQPAGKCSKVNSATQETSPEGDCERRPSTVVELADAESESNQIVHQI